MKYFQPLFIFIVGNLMLLFAMLFFPALGTAQTALETSVSGYASNFWGLSWVITSVKLLVFLVFEGLILFATAKAFLGLK